MIRADFQQGMELVNTKIIQKHNQIRFKFAGGPLARYQLKRQRTRQNRSPSIHTG